MVTDNEQFTRHWTQAQPVVAGYISSMVTDFHEAEDLLQDVAVVLLRKFGEYDSRRPFVAWALGVARYEILSSRRAHARSFLSYRPEVVDAVTESYAEMAPELDARAAALRRCLSRVKGRGLKLLQFRYEKALKPREIAERVNMKAGAVRVMLTRVRDALRACIEKHVSPGGHMS
ncbi:MAG: sigma-70 family RNA polymerase sigma factor [Kiritimatiellae bacterium]|nr:sigma-70 family RNA polymerase sigma factor [Kiritimatiellia bacterium]